MALKLSGNVIPGKLLWMLPSPVLAGEVWVAPGSEAVPHGGERFLGMQTLHCPAGCWECWQGGGGCLLAGEAVLCWGMPGTLYSQQEYYNLHLSVGTVWALTQGEEPHPAVTPPGECLRA